MMIDLVAKLQNSYPKLKFSPSDSFYWSPETNEVFYLKDAKGKLADWSLLHEAGHGLLNHDHYEADFMLLRLEIEAWQKAKEIAGAFNVKIDEDHIQDCLDTYRDWLHKRSICPKCSNKSLQQSDFSHYSCFNCHMRWRVTTSRFCRTYRMADDTVMSQQVFI
jgi:hypothetical protein